MSKMVEEEMQPSVAMGADDILQEVAAIVSAYVSHNSLRPEDLTGLIREVHGKLTTLNAFSPEAVVDEKPEPAVPVKKSVTPDHLISLFDGRKYKSLKRYLSSQHGMTPDQYRAHFGLPADYPMVAPAYAKQRSQLAKQSGLGHKTASPAVEAAPAEQPKRGRGRPKSVAA